MGKDPGPLGGQSPTGELGCWEVPRLVFSQGWAALPAKEAISIGSPLIQFSVCVPRRCSSWLSGFQWALATRMWLFPASGRMRSLDLWANTGLPGGFAKAAVAQGPWDWKVGLECPFCIRTAEVGLVSACA